MEHISRHLRLVFIALLYCSTVNLTHAQNAAGGDYSVDQITFGPKHHLFGYIGHAGTIPWNASGRYIIALRSTFQDHMPQLDEPATIVFLDARDSHKARQVETTRAWNPQQGSMLYWNPEAPKTQFFFNDRDPTDGTLFTVLFDISRGERGERVREYRFPESPVANSGVAQTGGQFLALNYGRLARLRLVTGYAGLDDWSQAENAPKDDGIFQVDVESGRRTLLVSYRQLRDVVRDDFEDIDEYGWFINGHKRKDLKQSFFTLLREQDGRVIQTRGFSIGPWLSGTLRIDPAPCWNRDSDQILFGAYDDKTQTRQLFLLKIDP